MSTRKLELRHRYDETADFYDKRYERIQREKYKAAVKYLPERAKIILDLGCGTGMLLKELAGKGEFVVGVDSSAKMLSVAKKRGREAALICADADHLPFKDKIFDVVVSITLLQNVPVPVTMMKEISRVLKPGGVGIVTSLKHKHSPEQLREWAASAGLKPLLAEEMLNSEDVICVARV